MMDEARRDKLRLQVFLSRHGVCSRRKAMSLIQAGAVSVNGQTVIEPSTAVNPARDRVAVDGRPVEPRTTVYVLLHKPAGTVTTRADRHAERIVTELLPPSLRHLHPVGRLDRDTAGLLLMTNDGDLTLRMTHPRFGMEKTYAVTVRGRLAAADARRLENGVMLDGKKTAQARVTDLRRDGPDTVFELTIHEGRKRQVRRMTEAFGHPVLRLVRVRQGPLTLGRLRPGEWRELTEQEIVRLKKSCSD